MRHHPFLCGLIVLSGSLGATSAFAASDTGLDLGARLGYGIPLGKAIGGPGPGNGLSDLVTGQVPIWIDAGYRVTPNVMVGAYFQYGFAFVKDCPSGASCSAHDIRLGLQAQYRIQPTEKVDPWVGFGIGYEWLGLSASAAGLENTATLKGFEFANFQGGVDFAVADGFGIGPFLSFSLGEYSSGSATATTTGAGAGAGAGVVAGAGAGSASASASGDITNKALHEWLVLGVRGVFDP